ncbi:MAG TPA: metalloregulator ArsR/SmtB family transcription factor [Gemmatimonadaceae bacterium]|nr:metalloregulator ArsR/SmtB family transcription factor [Gemmatimonadaceae bacterium]HRQ78226.1 metalloregulator ArsR/SmtB family transcription factor [Gemmatimonadaceae bacterium]
MSPRRSATRQPTPALLERVATRFRALAEPARLSVLHALEDGERTVSELVELTGLAQGNLSKHLQQLYAAGFVTRRRDGLFVQYALADEGVLQLCTLMCDRLDDDVEAERAVIIGARRR